MSQSPHQTVVVQQAPNTSGLAIAGLVFAILGWFTFGLMCIPGAFLCFLSLFSPGPKGAAVAGLIVGFPGTLFFAFMGLGIIMGFFGIGAAATSAVSEAERARAEAQTEPQHQTPDVRQTTPATQGELVQDTSEPNPGTPTSEPLSYTIVEEQDVSFGRTIRITPRVVIRGQHSRATILATAKAVVEEITKRKSVNAISVFFYSPTADTSADGDIAVVEWAPEGEWGEADSVTTGDYSHHRYHVFAYYPPPRSTVQLAVADELTGMGVPIPVGATLGETRVQTDDQDAYEEYEIDASCDDLIAFFLQQLPAAGWASHGRPESATLSYKRGNDKILVGATDGSFWVMGDEPQVSEEVEAKQKAAVEAARAWAEKKARKAAEIEAAKWRTWTTANGKYTVEAEFGGMLGQDVLLKKKDGKTVSVPLEKLSEADRKWIAGRR